MLIFRKPNPRPQLSGKWSALLLSVCFLASAVAIPVAAHLPEWIEFELVAGVWWLVWVLVLAYLLFNAHEVEDDVDPPSLGERRSKFFSGDPDGCGTILATEAIQDLGCGLGCFGEGGAIVGLVLLAVLGIWFAIEFLIPLIAFLLYLAIKGMLSKVVDRECHCEGDGPRSLIWGMIWATVYTAPIALAIWVIKALVLKP